jgi:hypothetical protein
MKKSILIFAMAASFVSVAPTTQAAKKAEISASFSRYAVTGYTRNQFGQNYSISLQIDGESGSYGSYINNVYYNDGYSWRKAFYSKVFGEDDTYSVSVGYSTYYFTF